LADSYGVTEGALASIPSYDVPSLGEGRIEKDHDHDMLREGESKEIGENQKEYAHDRKEQNLPQILFRRTHRRTLFFSHQ
jgi:hypothetical protein